MLDNLKEKHGKREQLTHQLEGSLAIRELIGLSFKSMEALKSQIIKPSGVTPLERNPTMEGFIFRITREDGSYTDRPLNEVPKILGGTKA